MGLIARIRTGSIVSALYIAGIVSCIVAEKTEKDTLLWIGIILFVGGIGFALVRAASPVSDRNM
jgi:hypothetical protein